MSNYPQFTTLSEVVSFHAEKTPVQPALVFNRRTTTYSELDRHARQLANGLAQLLQGQQRFAVLSKNNDCFYELLMATGKCAAVLVGINWRLAAREIEYILADSQTRVLFVDEEYFALLDSIREQLPQLQTIITFTGHYDGATDYSQWRDQHSDGEPAMSVSGTDIAMQLYTSGTTGHPKGVQLSHRALLSLREAEQIRGDWAKWDSSDVALVAMPLFHIGGTATGLIALYNGSTSVIMPEVDPGRILQLLKEYGVTRTFLVPAVIQLLIDHPDCDASVFKNLKVLLYGASPIPAALLNNAMALMQCGFAQVYGLTETAGAIAALEPDDHLDPYAKKMASCGKPLPTVEIAIVDQKGERQEVGQVGEIIINSPSLLTGYWRLDEATREAIHDGWFYTGDAGYLDEEGYLYIYDRVKDMIVSGGENIYPAEVESVLYAHPGVKDVAVIGVPSEKWGEAVKAVVVPTPGSGLTAEQLIEDSRSELAAYKLPKSVDFTDQLPRNASGKLLKKDIRKPYWEGMSRKVN